MSIYSLLIFFIVIIFTHCELNSARDDVSSPKPNNQSHDPVTSNATLTSRAKRAGVVIPRIIRGYECSTKEHGFIALLLEWFDKEWTRLCGSSIIKAKWILTAAHCIRYPKRWYGVIVNMNTKEQFIYVKRKIVHPQFEPETYLNDIALLELDSPLSETNGIRFVKLPRAQTKYTSDKPICSRALVIGWGTMLNNRLAETHNLQCAKIPMISSRECNKLLMYHHQISLPPNQICTHSTQGVDACQGDSGGPLLCGSIQVGIVSWGISCAEPTNPGVYTDIAKYSEYIAKITVDVVARDVGTTPPPTISGSTIHFNFICCAYMLIIFFII